jgi:ubiquinone/menaquinone biosynthesis C-methylase UbiE
MTMKNNWRYIDFSDLATSHIEITRLSYDSHSAEYAEKWEWNDEIKKRTKNDYLDLFMKSVCPGGIVLVVGCGTGRDLKILGNNNFRYLGIDSSQGMLKEAVEKRKVDGPVLCNRLEEINLADSSFDGVLIDSALEHIRKADMEQVLDKLYKSLKKRGICLLRFRLGSGKVFVVDDNVGRRYFTSYTREETDFLVKSNGYKVCEAFVSNHLEDSRPGFLTFVLRK